MTPLDGTSAPSRRLIPVAAPPVPGGGTGELERMRWSDGLAFRSHGVSIGVRVTDAAHLPAVRAAVPPGSMPQASPAVDHLFSLVGESAGAGQREPLPGRPAGSFAVYQGSRRVAAAWDLPSAADRLATELRHCVAVESPTRVFVHAGVVAWRDRAILVPGRSRSGKTTLVAELLRRGAVYYSDEYAVLDQDGRIHPFPKPLSVRSPGDGSPLELSPRALGARPGIRPLRAVTVAVTEFVPSGRWRPRTLSRGEGVLALLANTVTARSEPRRAMAAVAHALQGALVLDGPRGEAARAAEILLARTEAWIWWMSAGERPDDLAAEPSEHPAERRLDALTEPVAPAHAAAGGKGKM